MSPILWRIWKGNWQHPKSAFSNLRTGSSTAIHGRAWASTGRARASMSKHEQIGNFPTLEAHIWFADTSDSNGSPNTLFLTSCSSTWERVEIVLWGPWAPSYQLVTSKITGVAATWHRHADTQIYYTTRHGTFWHERYWHGMTRNIWNTTRNLVPRSATKILVPRSWYQKNGEPGRRSLLVCRGARRAASPPPGGLGGWKPPRNSRGSGGWQPPSKNIFVGTKIKNLDTAWHGIFMTRHDTQKYGMTRKNMAWHGTGSHDMAWHGTGPPWNHKSIEDCGFAKFLDPYSAIELRHMFISRHGRAALVACFNFRAREHLLQASFKPRQPTDTQQTEQIQFSAAATSLDKTILTKIELRARRTRGLNFQKIQNIISRMKSRSAENVGRVQINRKNKLRTLFAATSGKCVQG